VTSTFPSIKLTSTFWTPDWRPRCCFTP